MRIYLFLLALIYCISSQATQLIAFERGDSIWIAHLDGSKARYVTKGAFPEISPDGKYITFNVGDNDETFNRFIATIELATGKVTLFKNMPTNNNFSPTWSPDSKIILFNAYVENDWHLALINADGNGYRVIKNTKGEYSPAWFTDGKSFFSHDMESIYWMNLDGSLIKKWPLNTIIPNSDMSSASRIQVSPDGKNLIMDVDMRENVNNENLEEPPSAIWTLNLDSEKTTRLTPKGISAWSPFWITSEEFVFIEQKTTEKNPSIYRGSIKGTPYSLLLKDALKPSVSR